MNTKAKLAPWEKILPNQDFNNNLFNSESRIFEQAAYNTILGACGFETAQNKFKIEQTDMFTIEEMASSPVVLGFIQWILCLIGARRVLEIGAFVGVSAMHFAEVLPSDGSVVSLEKFDHFAEIAKRNFISNGFEDKIELICGDAIDTIGDLKNTEPFDLVFVDGNKERYADYMKLAVPLLRPGGVMVVDDVFFHGDALNDKCTTDKGRGCKAVLGLASEMSNWRSTLIPMSNGILLMTKPNA